MKYIFPLILLQICLMFSVWGISGKVISAIPLPREKFKPSQKAFEAEYLVFDYKLNVKKPLQGAVIVKDKDGNLFQSRQEWTFDKTENWKTLRVRIDDRAQNWYPYSNRERWNAQIASAVFEYGLSLWSQEENMEIKGEVRNLRYEGIRKKIPLAVTTITAPEKGTAGKIFSVKFQLSREYFNPFDPDEVAVDCEWQTPDQKKVIFPAFFTKDHHLEYNMTEERAVAEGLPHWELRYFPKTSGKHQFRIIVKEKKETVSSEWKTVEITPAPVRGVVRVSKQNHHYFEYENGEFFFPVGLNIHSNTDYRAEARLRIAPLADMGLKDYERYFKLCSAAGINCIEVWMASWTFALEWSARRLDYMGVGRYNLANATRLDKLFEMAEKYGILINLIFDNHGKFSAGATQEWYENPFNKHSTYAEADGGFITSAENLFTNEKYKQFWYRRNRYIAARYGQNPNIFAIELWSEVDLVFSFYPAYHNKTVDTWHSQIIKNYQSFTPVRHLITTHVCGDIHNNNGKLRLWQLPEVTHLVGDAYRSDRIPMTQQLRYQSGVFELNKPRLITEFGGHSSGSGNGLLESDLHAGLWGAIFKKQAGLPFLWWHDFAISDGRLQHFHGVTKFLKNMDLRDPMYQSLECKVIAPPDQIFNTFHPGYKGLIHSVPPWEREFESMCIRRKDEFNGWVYHKERMFHWTPRTNDPLSPHTWREIRLLLPGDFVPGKWRVEFYDTISGDCILAEDRVLTDFLELPGFEDDIAFKLRRIK